MNDTSEQQGRRRAPRTLKRDAAGRFVSPGRKRVETSKARFKTLTKKAKHITQVMLSIVGVGRDKFIASREYPLPICRAILYEDLYKDGYGTFMIGRAFNKDHATVLHGLGVLRDLLAVGDRKTKELYDEYNEQKNNKMTNLFYAEVTYQGGLRKVEAALHESIYKTYGNAVITEEALPKIIDNLKEAVTQKAAELKAMEVPVALSPSYKDLPITTPRFLSVGRITLVLHPVTEVIGLAQPIYVNADDLQKAGTNHADA